MDGQYWITLVIGIIMFCWFSWMFKNPRPKGTRGPMALPILGTVYKHGLNAQKLTQLASEYGDICCIYIGSRRTILLNNYKAITTAMKKQLFVNRGLSESFIVKIIDPNFKGVGVSDYSNEVKDARRFTLSTMRDLGIGRSAMEERILEEADELVNVFKRMNGESCNAKDFLSVSIANIIMHICFNVRYEHGDIELLNFIDTVARYMAAAKQTKILDNLPFLRLFDPYKSHMKNYVEGNQIILDTLWKHAKPYFGKESPKEDVCFVKGFIDLKLKESPDYEMDVEQLRYLLKDLLVAGFETVATTLHWTILLLVNRPKVQTKMQKEIDDVIGDRLEVKVSDKESLPYTEAVIQEIQRYSSVAPVMFFSSSKSKDANLLGVEIPRDTFAIVSYYSIHFDKEIWGDPENLRPERFLSEEGKFQKSPFVFPFGLGKRSCIGELLAKQELFLFVVKLFQNFTFKATTENSTPLSEEGTEGLVRCPMPFEIKAISRKN